VLNTVNYTVSQGKKVNDMTLCAVIQVKRGKRGTLTQIQKSAQGRRPSEAPACVRRLDEGELLLGGGGPGVAAR